MDLLDLIKTRRTIHAYQPDALPEGAIEEALGAALLAPNHKLTFPWRFTRVGRTTRAKLADLDVAKRTADAGGKLPEKVIAKTRAKLLDPPALIVVSLVRCDKPAQAREDYAACACAIENFMLALHARGIGSKWSTGKITGFDETYAILGIERSSEEVIAFVWAGYAAAPEELQPRPRLSEVLRELP